MLIIIEGMDKCGKSTLGEYLLKNLPKSFMMKNGSKPKDGSEEEMMKIIKAYNTMLDCYFNHCTDCNMIFDRFLLSEFVYCYKRGYESYNNKHLQSIKRLLEESKDDVVMIYCWSNIQEIKNNFVKDKEDYVKVEEVENLRKRYDKFIKKFNLKVLTYNYKFTKPEQVCNMLMNMNKKGINNEED
jgi:thymidylate kinase